MFTEKNVERANEIVLQMGGADISPDSEHRKGCINYKQQEDGRICISTTNKSCVGCQFFTPTVASQRDALFAYAMKKEAEVEDLTQRLDKANEELAYIHSYFDKALENFLFLFGRSGIVGAKKITAKTDWTEKQLCGDPRPCFARNKNGYCTILMEAPEKSCSFCKPKQNVTKGKKYDEICEQS